MKRSGFQCILFWSLIIAVLTIRAATAQTGGEGAIRGFVRDGQGQAVSGATITAKSPDAPRPLTTITESDGQFRLLNVPAVTFQSRQARLDFQTQPRPASRCARASI